MDTVVLITVIILISLGSIRVAYGTNLPKGIKWLSFASSTMAGVVLGLYSTSFPQNVLLAIFFAIAFNALFIFSQWLRRGLPW